MPKPRTSRKLYAVMGNPVRHSKSPAIHHSFAKQCGIDLEYRAIEVEAGGFAAAVQSFRARGGHGLNITVPFKLEAYALADRRSARAQQAGAVNTFRFEPDGPIYGDNTDGIGLVRDLVSNCTTPLSGRRVLVLGAGGAARGIVGPILEEGVAQLLVANRTVSKAKELVAMFASHPEMDACGLGALAGRRFDIVINGTAASLQGETLQLPPDMFAPGALAYDLMYGEAPTPFLQWARAQGATRISDGLGMLVEQAAESFLIWHGRRPQTNEVLKALRAVYSKQ
jgi:shikimate dehydrogenase